MKNETRGSNALDNDAIERHRMPRSFPLATI
jgi:hypothetical protein